MTLEQCYFIGGIIIGGGIVAIGWYAWLTILKGRVRRLPYDIFKENLNEH